MTPSSRLPLVACSALALLLCGGSAMAAGTVRSLERLLASQGFEASFDRGDTFKNLGRIHSGHTTYIVYHLEHVDQDPTGPHDATQWLLLITDRGKFVGEYDVTADVLPTISGHDIVYNVPESEGNRIHFGPKGPPKSIFIDGVQYDFWPARSASKTPSRS